MGKKIHMVRGHEATVVEEHSVPAREAQGWTKATAKQAEKAAEQAEPAKKGN